MAYPLVPIVKDYFHGKQGLEMCSAVSTEAVLKIVQGM